MSCIKKLATCNIHSINKILGRLFSWAKHRTKKHTTFILALALIWISITTELPYRCFFDCDNPRPRVCFNCNTHDFPVLIGANWHCRIKQENNNNNNINNNNNNNNNNINNNKNINNKNIERDFVPIPLNSTASVLFLIHSRPESIGKRQAIRSTWYAQARRILPDAAVDILFVFGKSKDENIDDFLVFESRTFGDIMQEDFVDNYDNLTLKALMGLKWSTQRCSSARFVVKADDDVLINVPNLLTLLASSAAEANYVGGRCNNSRVVRNSIFSCLKPLIPSIYTSKWAVSHYEYPYSRYPRSCTGFLIIYLGSASRRIFAASPHIPHFRFDDIYTTGFVGHQFLGIAPTAVPGVDSLVLPAKYDWCRFKARKIAVHLGSFAGNMKRLFHSLNDCPLNVV